MEIPDYLIKQISEGRVVLFLGSGASADSSSKDGRKPPTGNGLSQLLSRKFLGGKYDNASLAQVGDFAISESDLITVQQYIKSLFEDFEPTVAHRITTSFRWHGIVTTNYDLLVEKAYEEPHSKPAQILQKFVEHGDRIEEKLRDPNSVPFLKLHGCITRASNDSCPLILSVDQYLTYRKCRERIFNHFYN